MVQAIEFQQLLGKNVACVISPILKIVYLDCEIDPDGYDAFVFTSRNGVNAANRIFELKGRRAFAVGRRTAELAVQFGMEVTHSEGGAKELVEHISQNHQGQNLLFLRGEHSLGQITDSLNQLGFPTDQAVIYRQDCQPLTAEARAVVCGAKPVIIPLFSPRSAGIVGKEIDSCGASAPICLIGMSQQVAQAWKGPQARETHVLSRPTLAGMVEKTLQQFGTCT